MTGPRVPKRPPQAAADATATDPLRRKRDDEADDALIAKSDSAMAANPDLIPGGKYLDAQRRKRDRSPASAEDLERWIRAEPQPEDDMTKYGDPRTQRIPLADYKADPELLKMIKVREKRRKHL
jgi:hypothetical protein